MQANHFEEIYMKIDALPDDIKNEVKDFVDYLYLKYQKKADVRKLLMSISVWSKEDISYLKDLNQEYKKWTIQEF